MPGPAEDSGAYGLPDDVEYTQSPVGPPAEEIARARRKLAGLMERAQTATGVDAARLGAQAAFMIDDIEKRGIAVELDTDAQTIDILDADEIIPIARPLSPAEVEQARARLSAQGLDEDSTSSPGQGEMIREAYAHIWHPWRPDCTRARHSHWPAGWPYEATKKIQEKFAHD